MGKEVFKKLAEHLDGMPHGYPASESGVELKILEWIFTEEEAEVGAQIKMMPENAADVAERLGRDPKEMAEMLETMTSKGQIMGIGPKESRMYGALPYIAGIHEFQLPRIDKEYVELFEEYFEESFAKQVAKEAAPSQIRVYPVEQAIDAERVILPFEKVSNMIESAQAWGVVDCICRREKEIIGKGCGKTMNNCIALSPDPNGFDIDYRGTTKISKEEALDLAKKAAEEGLVHNAWNVQEGHMFLCNCCTCCCLVLRGIKAAPQFAAKSNYYAEINADSCIACGVCADDRCPMEAIDVKGESFTVNREKCIGCGVCVITCPSGALSLQRKAEDEVDMPPDNMMLWTMEKAQKTSRTMEGLM
jgi:NAD-dependent dihydropyrimidine dehydrogenase PreA subunit